jgi:hypothetical protein
MATYYVRDPETGKVLARRLKREARALAQRLANKWGVPVDVRDDTGFSVRKVVEARRNPAGPRLAPMTQKTARAVWDTGGTNVKDGMEWRAYARREGIQSTNPKGILKAVARRTGHLAYLLNSDDTVTRATPDGKLSTASVHMKRTPSARKAKISGVRAPSREARSDKRTGKGPRNGYPAGSMGARLYEEAYKRNPRKPPVPKAVAARKIAKRKAGYIVEFKYGTTVERERAANKGLATVKANNHKRNGARAVRVYQA